MYLHKLSSGFQQHPEFALILLKRQVWVKALAWRPTLALVPSPPTGLHTYTSQGEKGMDDDVLLHSFSPVLCLVNTQ